MRQIRRSVFETNSSSMHSVVIHKSDTSDMLYPESDNYVHTHFDEFGWSYDGECGPFYDAETKLSYLVTMMAENSGCDIWCTHGMDTDKIYDELMAENEEFVELNELIKHRCNCDGLWIDAQEGYIDHQSMCPSVANFLSEEAYVNSMEDFIFDSGVGLIIDNDNH